MSAVLQAKQLFRVSHFNPAGIALTSFYISRVVQTADPYEHDGMDESKVRVTVRLRVIVR